MRMSPIQMIKPLLLFACYAVREVLVPKVHFGGGRVVERLMGPVLIVKAEIFPDPPASFAGRLIVVQVNILIFHGSPQPFRKDIIESTTFAIHTDLHRMRFEQLYVLRTGDMKSA
jgi:hypothetical protein